MPKPIAVALIGQKFMGRAHSNAYGQVGRFFDLPRPVRMHTIAARDRQELEEFARRWGWENTTDDWRELGESEEIDLVDVGTPNDVHAEQSIAMLRAGKHVACEKPLAGTLDDARSMRDAARKAKGKTFVWYNYRRCPAVALAYKMMREGKLGRIYHVRARYLQSWGGPDTPLLWRFQKKRAGSGAHGDLNAHIVDMARFLMGEEVSEVHGAVARTFIRERVRPEAEGTGGLGGKKRGAKKGKSDVDDCVLFLASFKSGATASFEATRLAGGHQNDNGIEINGDRGSLRFDFEDMNLLWYFDGRHRTPMESAAGGGSCARRAGIHPYAGSLVARRAPDRLRARRSRTPWRPTSCGTSRGRHRPWFRCPTSRTPTRPSACSRPRSWRPSERCAVKLSEVR